LELDAMDDAFQRERERLVAERDEKIEKVRTGTVE
jgi:hypothetical protein